MVLGDDLPDEREAEAPAGPGLAGLHRSVERFEDALAFGARNAWSAITDAHDRLHAIAQQGRELEPRGDQVLLTVTPAHISDRRNMVMIGAGRHMHLEVLAARLQGTRPEPFWDGWARLRTEYDRRIPG